MKKSRIKYNNGGTVKQTTYNNVASIEAGARGNNNNSSADVTGSLQGKGLTASARRYINSQGYRDTIVKGSYNKNDFSISGQHQRDNYGNKETTVRLAQGPVSATARRNRDGNQVGLHYQKTTRKGTTFGANLNRNAEGLFSASMTFAKSL